METQPRLSRRLLILYGSQTGTAEDVAQQISRGARRLHFKTELASMDSYERDKIFEEDLVVFVCSTTGQGTQPQNMIKFWNGLKRANLPTDFIDNVRFTVFGLGDSSYPKFNWVAKKLFRRLSQLGAQSFYERGEADDQNRNGSVPLSHSRTEFH
jgi:sulfite reductase alpha subunit-like flavoprotein